MRGRPAGAAHKCMSYKPKKQLNVLEAGRCAASLSDIAQQTLACRISCGQATYCCFRAVMRLQRQVLHGVRRDHVAIVVAPSRALLRGGVGGGIFVSPLKERLTDYFEAQGRLIAVRRLWTPAEAVRQDLESFIERAMASGLGA